MGIHLPSLEQAGEAGNSAADAGTNRVQEKQVGNFGTDTYYGDVQATLHSLADTQTFAEQLAQSLPNGALVLLNGPLGAGKTTLVQFLAKAMGFRGEVTSPTYTLIHEYPTPKGLIVHIDAYRMADQEELYNLGLEDYLPEARVVLIEWGKPEVFPSAVQIRITPCEEGRQVEVKPPLDALG